MSVKKNEETFNLIRPVTPGTTMSLDDPVIDDNVKRMIKGVTFIKINEYDICEDAATVKDYKENAKYARIM